MFRHRAVAMIFLAALLIAPVSALEGIVDYPFLGVTVMPGDPGILPENTVEEITEFKWSVPYILAHLYSLFQIGETPIWTAELIVICISIGAALTTSGCLILYTRRKVSNGPDSRPMVILDFLSKHPGAQQTEIIQATGFSRGSVSYHLKKLVAEQKIYRTKNNTTHYYPIGSHPSAKNPSDRLLEDEKRLTIFQTILQNPGISQKEISRETNIPLTTLRWHLKKLQKGEYIFVERQGHNMQYSINPNFHERKN